MDCTIIILLCINFPLTTKLVGCCNMLESSPARIPLIELSHKWTQILFYYFEFQTCNLVWQSSLNRCKLKIQPIWCSKYRHLNTLSLTSSTLKSSLSTNYTLGTDYIFNSLVLFPFHESVQQISFPLHSSLIISHCCYGIFQISKVTVWEIPSNLSSK